MSSRFIFVLAVAGALLLACTHEPVANHPEAAGSPASDVSHASGVPDGSATGATPDNDLHNSPEHPTPPGTPPEDQRIPEGIAPGK